MTKHWKHPVICSHITAKLVLLKIRCDAKYLTALPLNQPEVIENVEVTLLDANHCPGSVMFLFKVNWRNSHRSSWRIPKTSGLPGRNFSRTHSYDNFLDHYFLRGKHINNTKGILVGVLEKFKSYLLFPFGILQELIWDFFWSLSWFCHVFLQGKDSAQKSC